MYNQIVVCADRIDIIHYATCILDPIADYIYLKVLFNCRLCSRIVMIDTFIGITITVINKITVGYILIFLQHGPNVSCTVSMMVV